MALSFHFAAELIVLFSLVVVAVSVVQRLRNRAERKGHPLPPGPPFLPLLASSLSAYPSWEAYTTWADKYKSGIIYARLLDQDTIILNTFSDSVQLLEKRSHMYSDRPHIASVEPYGQDFNFAFQQYGDHWRLCRRIFHQSFRAEAALTFRPSQLRRSRQMVANIMDDPESYQFHFSTFAAAVAMLAAWHYEPSPRNDPIVAVADNFFHASLQGLTPQRTFLIMAFPFLLHVPDWLPGSWLKREARASRVLGTQMLDTLFQYVQDRIDSKLNASCLVAQHIALMQDFDETYKAEYSTAVKRAAYSALLGATDSTLSTLMTFTLAMVENPEVWKQAHAEIDAVVGTERLPNFEDRVALSYVSAICREVARWHPAAPLGVPHTVMSNDIYKGYFIPKGATIFANVWAIARDEARYPDAHKFIPDRFLDKDGALTDDNPADYIFGFGRRICPGRHNADSTIWIAIATMLATLEFHRAKDERGEDVMFEAKFINSATHRPYVFPCRLVPRADITREALEQMLVV